MIRRSALAAPLLALAACAPSSVLAPDGPVAAANRQILFNALGIMLAIVVPTIIGTLAVAWWFRAGNRRANYQPQFVYSGRIEMLVWSVPLLIIMFLGGVIWVGSHDLDPRRPLATAAGQARAATLEVQVVSLDWKWLFIYPAQGVATVNRLVLPVGVPVHFRLTSASVMNTFFVPRLGSMIYTMNGMETQLNLRADHPGRVWGQSAHFSGDGFSDMNFAVEAMPTGDFAAWAAQTRAAPGPVLDTSGYVALAQQSQDVHPYAYRAAQPGLFDAVVTQRIKPAPGPHQGRGGDAHVSPGTPE